MWLKCYSINIPLFPSGFRAKKDLDVDRRCHLGGEMDQHGNLVVSFRITLHPPLPLSVQESLLSLHHLLDQVGLEDQGLLRPLSVQEDQDILEVQLVQAIQVVQVNPIWRNNIINLSLSFQ